MEKSTPTTPLSPEPSNTRLATGDGEPTEAAMTLTGGGQPTEREFFAPEPSLIQAGAGRSWSESQSESETERPDSGATGALEGGTKMGKGGTTSGGQTSAGTQAAGDSDPQHAGVTGAAEPTDEPTGCAGGRQTSKNSGGLSYAGGSGHCCAKGEQETSYAGETENC